MPCVNLRNTFRYWQRLKALQIEERKLRAPIKPAKDIADRGLFSDTKVLRVPHPHVPRTSSNTNIYSPKPAKITGKPSRADLINAESRLGSAIFGPIPAGHRREFFHDQNNIWIWHEDWLDQQQNSHQMTVRYEVRSSGVYKKVSTGKYFKLEGDELENFRKATHAYLYMIKRYLYNKPKNTLQAA